VAHSYAEGLIGGLAFIGNGQCSLGRIDFPENGLDVARCHLELRSLPAPYVGGFLTSNTMTSKQAIGDVSDPPGHVQSSIATVRLWRTE
jgi:hypothetical protein